MDQPITTTTNAPLAKTTHFLGALLSVTAGIFAYSDKLSEIFAINPKLAQWWPIILAAATFIDRMVKLALSIVNGWQNAAPFIILTFFLCSGCATTKIYNPNGKLLLATGANASNLSFTAPGITLSVQDLDHSITNQIVADGLKNGGTTAAGIISTAAILTK